MDGEATSYMILSADGSRQIGINIEEIVKAESRLDDIAIVNIQTAPYLLKVFNRAWLDLNRVVSLLASEKLQAENGYNRAKAEALLDCTNERLKERGHAKASADLREALAELDPRVTKSKEILDRITPLLMFLKGKQEAFREGFSAVKKLIDTRQLPGESYHDGNRPPINTPTKQTITHSIVDSSKKSFLDLPEGFSA